MNKPSDAIIETVAPNHDVGGLAISDGASVRNVAHQETHDALRIPRGGPHDASLVIVRKTYDGSNGGIPRTYVLAYTEFRASGSRWRTVGSKIRQEEAARIARDMMKGVPSKPGRSESDRVGGKTVATDESELRGAPLKDGAFLIYVRHKNRAGEWVRTRGVEVIDAEVPVVGDLLRRLAKEKTA